MKPLGAAVLGAAACGLTVAAAMTVRAAGSAEAFQAQMDAAMAHMHQGMMVRPTGDPDRDFAAAMIPHHQGAVDMARAELAYGKDERLRRLSQAIIVEQTQEIAVMRQILDERAPASPPAQGGRRP